jgi:hypothetical protein
VLGKEHPSALDSMNNLALVIRSQGKYEEAEELHRPAEIYYHKEYIWRRKCLAAHYICNLCYSNRLFYVLHLSCLYISASSDFALKLV